MILRQQRRQRQRPTPARRGQQQHQHQQEELPRLCCCRDGSSSLGRILLFLFVIIMLLSLSSSSSMLVGAVRASYIIPNKRNVLYSSQHHRAAFFRRRHRQTTTAFLSCWQLKESHTIAQQPFRIQPLNQQRQRQRSEFSSSSTTPISNSYEEEAFSATLPPPSAAAAASYDNTDSDNDNDNTSTTTSSSSTKTINPINPIILDGLNPSQVRAVTQPLDAITRVVAGPGSGKTRVLTCRIAHTLLQTSSEHDDNDKQQQQQQSRVLAVTFTRKAAGEMQKRLHNLLLQTTAATDATDSDDDTNIINNNNNNNNNDIIVEEEEDQKQQQQQPPYPKELHRVTLGTFHSICAKILRWNGELLETLPSVTKDMYGSSNATTVLDGSFGIIDEGEQLRIVRDCLDEANIDLNAVNLKPRPVVSAIAECRSAVLAQGQDPFFLQNNIATTSSSSSRSDRQQKQPSKAMQVAAKIYYRYRAKLLSRNCLDFDDLIYLTRELLLEYDDVRQRLQRRWTHVLVDEFQDTSKTQLDLVKLLTSSSLLVVGDADQSIYSWRGAHVGSLSDFEHEFQHFNNNGGVETIYLMENYRSTSNIVKAAQKVISHSNSGSGADKLRMDMKPKRGSGRAPRIVSFENDKAEADYAVTSVKRALAAGNYTAGHSVAFIYRTNAQSRALEEACVKHNLPYVIFGSATSFYKRQEIKDCLCFLRWLHNGRDRTAMLRAMSTPKRGLGDVAIREFDAYCKAMEEANPTTTPLDVLISFSLSGSDSSALDPGAPHPSDFISKRPLKLLTEFSIQMRSIRDLAFQQPLENVLAAIVSDLGLFSHLDKLSKSAAEFEERKQNVRELQQATLSYTSQGPCLVAVASDASLRESPLGNFLDDVALVTDLAERSSEERFVVNLMTAHASKGMEFDTVFVLGNEDGTFPTSQSLQDGEESKLEEEKRLCYVAMTRAKSELFLTWRREVTIFTPEGVRIVERPRSRFLDILAGKKKKANASNNKTGTEEKTQSWQQQQRRREYYGKQANGSNGDYNRRRYYSSARTTTIASPLSSSRQQKLEGMTSIYARQRKQQQRYPLGDHDEQQQQPPSHRQRKRYDEATTATRQQHQSATTHTTTRTRRRRREEDEMRRVVSTSNDGTGNYKARYNNDDNSMMTNGRHQTTTAENNNKMTNNENRRPRSAERKQEARSTRQQRRSSSTTNRMVDSTWFFPVGSQVVHKRLGKGVVLQPPPTAHHNSAREGVGSASSSPEQQQLLVHVEFENGEVRHFPVSGSDIAPAALF